MKKIKIRTKMMLWYTLLTSILLLVFIPVLYQSISDSFYNEAKSKLKSDISDAEAGVIFEADKLSWDENTIISGSLPTFVADLSENLIYSNSTMDQITDISFQDDTIRTVKYQGQTWLVLDEAIAREGTEVAHMRMFGSLKTVEETLKKVRIIIFISIPAYFLITILGGLFIAKKALQPINMITQTAKKIGRGDLSSRIDRMDSRDEVGELSETFNEMLEKLEDSFNKEKRFSSDASHELRTPVSIIMAYSEAMLTDIKEQKTIDDLEKSLQVIYKESERMNSIISQLLMLSRGFEGKYQVEKENINLTEIIENVTEQLEEIAEASDIQLIFTDREPVFFMGDQSLITHMMLNFVENAIKYGVKGGHVWVNTVKREDEVIIIVMDDGIGIAPEHLAHIFQRFYRVDQSRDRRGTGLGLSIVKWIVEEHQGTIEVSSYLGKGTTFEIHMKNN